MKKRVWLSVDWDFFMYEDPQWCMDHCEAQIYRLVQDSIWLSRHGGMVAQGVEIEKVTSPSKYWPESHSFWVILENAGFEFDIQDVYVSSSHSYAASTFLRKNPGPNRWIVNFDAHHDLGYCSPSEQLKLHRQKKTEAGSWLWSVLRRWSSVKAELFFPQWSLLSDDGFPATHGEPGLLPGMARRIDTGFCTSERLEAFAEDAVIDTVFICRSDAWTWPMHDEDFRAFVMELVMLYEPTLWQFEQCEGINPLEPRKQSQEQIDQMAAMYKAAESGLLDHMKDWQKRKERGRG